MYFQRNDDVDSTYTLHGSNVERTSVKRPKKKQNGELQNKTCVHELVMDRQHNCHIGAIYNMGERILLHAAYAGAIIMLNFAARL